MSAAIEKIRDGEKLIAIIVYSNFAKQGVHFFTSDDLSQQLAYMNHPTGKVIDAHVHNPIPRDVTYTQEVLFIKSGRLRVDFYSDTKCYLESRVLAAGDVILLISGGHGFEVLETVEMFETKQGPHVGDADKTRFSTVRADDVVIRNPEPGDE
jgi:mannose-6-phosphate isomerase-like protein (cupin superfamily)